MHHLSHKRRKKEDARAVSTSSACVSQSVGAQEIALTHANTRWFTRQKKKKKKNAKKISPCSLLIWWSISFRIWTRFSQDKEEEKKEIFLRS